MSRNLLDDSPAPRLIVHVFDGRTSVDTDRLRELTRLLDAVLAAVRGALLDLTHARAVVHLWAMFAPLNAPGALRALDDAARRMASLADLERRVEELRGQTVAALATYEEADNAARAVIARQGSLVSRYTGFLLGTVLPVLGVPRWFVPAVGGGLLLVDSVGDAMGDVPALVNMQRHLRSGAGLLNPIVNPSGVVSTAVGPQRVGRMAPVQFLASGVLDATGLDHFNGSVDVWVRDPLTQARYRSSVGGWDVITQTAVPIGASVAVARLTSVSDVLRRVRGAARESARTGLGRIELVAQTDSKGATSWTVVIPGTSEFVVGANPQDLLSDLQLMASERSDLMLAVKQALQMAPIGEGDTLILAGHSQGGMVAAELAADAAVNQRWDVAGVITMASPIGQVTGVPADVPVISLENVDDVVPALDGLANTVGGNHLTVQFDSDAHTALLGLHDMRTYEAAWAQALADGATPRLTALDATVRGSAGWADPDATARVYTFEFARSERGQEFLDTLLHVGLGVR